MCVCGGGCSVSLLISFSVIVFILFPSIKLKGEEHEEEEGAGPVVQI